MSFCLNMEVMVTIITLYALINYDVHDIFINISNINMQKKKDY